MNAHQIREYELCQDHFIYFLTKILKIDPNAFQLDVIDYVSEPDRVRILKSARQLGESTILIAWELWGALFHGQRIAHIPINQSSGKADERLAIKMVEDLPEWLKTDVVYTGGRSKIAVEDEQQIWEKVVKNGQKVGGIDGKIDQNHEGVEEKVQGNQLSNGRRLMRSPTLSHTAQKTFLFKSGGRLQFHMPEDDDFLVYFDFLIIDHLPLNQIRSRVETLIERFESLGVIISSKALDPQTDALVKIYGELLSPYYSDPGRDNLDWVMKTMAAVGRDVWEREFLLQEMEK